MNARELREAVRIRAAAAGQRPRDRDIPRLLPERAL